MAENEVYFRQQNESVQEGFKSLIKLANEIGQEDLIQETDTPLHFYCECSDENCRERIVIKPSEYTKIHANRNQFVIVPNHEVTNIEKVVAETPEYFVVQKFLDLPEDVDSLNLTPIVNA